MADATIGERRRRRVAGAITFSERILVFFLALLPVVPMPIAGGTPILLVLSIVTGGMTLIVHGKFSIGRPELMFLGLATALLAVEAMTASVHQGDKDFIFMLGRGFWIFTCAVTFGAVSPWVRAGRVDLVALTLALGLAILLLAMTAESLFYPERQFGRVLGVISLPFPRATGVPNSDGKLGTYFVICLAFFLFLRPQVSLWQKTVLQFGPWLGLMFTQSRSTLVAMGITYAVFWIWNTLKKNRAVVALVRFLGVLTAITIVLVIGDQIISNLVGEGIFKRNVEARFEHIDYGYEQIAAHPLIGAGADSVRESENTAGIHNTILAMSVKSGILSGILIAILLLTPIFFYIQKPYARVLGLAVSLGILSEHMLYPGFINEFLAYSLLVTRLGYVVGKPPNKSSRV